MRIASVSKAFNGAVALALVQQGRLRLDDPIGRLLGGLPSAWRPVTVRQLLNHTSGPPNCTVSPAFFKALQTPHAYVAPSEIIDWVRAEPLNFAPGSRFEYSNTDNVVVALIAEAVTHQPYHRLLSKLVLAAAKLRQTSFPTRAIAMKNPFMPGYQVDAGASPVDITTLLSPSQAWAPGALVSTPADLGTFIRDYLNGTFFGVAVRRQQLRFLPGASDPPGPGANAAGLAIFRDRTRCGTVYGHTGNYPGYTQWVAATADGTRSVTTSLNFSVPNGALLGRLRSLQATAVCLLLGR